jgi:uncharacterized membrane protein
MAVQVVINTLTGSSLTAGFSGAIIPAGSLVFDSLAFFIMIYSWWLFLKLCIGVHGAASALYRFLFRFRWEKKVLSLAISLRQ